MREFVIAAGAFGAFQLGRFLQFVKDAKDVMNGQGGGRRDR